MRECVCVRVCVCVCVCVSSWFWFIFPSGINIRFFFFIFFLKERKLIIIFERELKVKTAPPLFHTLGPTLNDSDDVIKENQAEIFVAELRHASPDFLRHR